LIDSPVGWVLDLESLIIVSKQWDNLIKVDHWGRNIHVPGLRISDSLIE